MVFKSDSKAVHGASQDENAGLIRTAAASVSPVAELNAENQAALCRTGNVALVQRNDVIKPEGVNRWLMYLVEGSLSLYSGKEEVGTISARSPEASKPLFHDKSAYQSVRPNSVARIVRFGREQLDILLREQQKNAIRVIDVQIGEAENALLDEILIDMAANQLQLASYQAAAARILSAHGKVGGIPELAEIIQADPGLTAHIIQAANRMEANADPTLSIRGAISRLGVETTKRSLEELLQANTLVAASPVIEKRFKRYVQRATLSSAIVQVLAREMPDLKPEVAMLVALTADIGELVVLSYANRHPELFADESALAGCIESMRSILGGWVLASWDFPVPFVEATSVARDWYRNHNGEITYADLVTAALLIIQSEMPDSEQCSIPAADNLLLARRLQQADIDLKSPEEIVKAATTKIVSVQQLLKAS